MEGNIMPSILGSIKDNITNKIDDTINVRELKKSKNIITELRVCNGKKENSYVNACIDRNNKKIYFTSKQQIGVGFVLVDSLLNLYKITSSCFERNPLLSNDTTTTICEYVVFAPTNPVRIFIQTAEINQNISNLNFENITGPVVLNFDQKAKIEQSLTLNQLAETARDENRYTFKPIKDLEQFISLIENIVNGINALDSLEEKIIKNIVNQATGFLKDIIEMILKKVR